MIKKFLIEGFVGVASARMLSQIKSLSNINRKKFSRSGCKNKLFLEDILILFGPRHF